MLDSKESVVSSANGDLCSSSALLITAVWLQLCDVWHIEAFIQCYRCSSLKLQILCVEVCVLLEAKAAMPL